MSGFLDRTFESRSVSLTSPEIVKILAAGQESFTGESITVEGALNVTAVLATFTILMEDVASLPLLLYRRMERGKERATRHPYYSLLHDKFNEEHTSMAARQTMMGHLLGWGNYYGQMIWDGRGVVREIWPLAPNRMQVFRENGERRYLYTEQNGNRVAFRQDDILHITDFTFDGLVGYSRISLSRNAIGLARAAEKYGSRIFANDARPSVLFKSLKDMTPETKQALRESWNQLYQGAGNAGRSAVLDRGVEFETIGFPPEDAQYIQSRMFSVEELSRVFRIPLHLLNHMEKATSWGSGIEQQEISYLNHSIRPWLVRIEQQLHKDLLVNRERRNYLIEHLVEAMLRTDIKSRYDAFAVAITNGWMSRNEARARDNMNAEDGLDEFLMQMNMKGLNDPEPEPEPAPNPFEPEPAPEPPAEPVPDRSLAPLLEDAMQRALRRESHEVRDAARRWLGKGKPEKFGQWLEQFYKSDQPQYLRGVFAPFIQAGLMDPTRLAQFNAAHSEAQGLRVEQALADEDDLEEITESWQELAPGLAATLMEAV